MKDWAGELWAETPVVVFDTETTGVRNSDTICEISIGVFQKGEVLSIFTSYVDPEQPIPPNVTEIHGIRDRDVVGAPKIGDLKDQVGEYLLSGAPIVAHGLGFDTRMILKTPLGELWPTDVPTLCTSDFARYRDPMCAHMPDHKLGTLSTYFGLYKERAGMHRAEADTMALGELLPRLMRSHAVGATMTKLSQDWIKSPKGKR
jgi:DNA polymerase III epsilon subunit-like protein